MKRLICAECGGDIVGRPGNAKYCLECVHEVERNRKRVQKQEVKPPARPAKPLLQAWEIELAARQAGMSYGEYVAQCKL